MPPSQLAGIGLMTLATLVFALQDAITKSLVQLLPIGQIVFVRFTAFAMFSLCFGALHGGLSAALRSRVPGTQIARCLMMCAEIALFAYALRFLGLAEIHALFACFPLVVAALSVPLLGEQVGRRRWIAVLVGFVGTLIILRPGAGVFDPFALLPLACAVIYALYNLLTRQVSRRDAFATSLVYFGLTGMIASAPFAWTQWQPVSAHAAVLLATLCFVSVSAHMMLIKALQLSEAVVLQPFHYLVLLWAMLVGSLFYGESIDRATVLGSLIVVGSGVYVAWREHALSERVVLRD